MSVKDENFERNYRVNFSKSSTVDFPLMQNWWVTSYYPLIVLSTDIGSLRMERESSCWQFRFVENFSAFRVRENKALDKIGHEIITILKDISQIRIEVQTCFPYDKAINQALQIPVYRFVTIVAKGLQLCSVNCERI